MEHLSHKALDPLFAETLNGTDTPRTKNLKFLRCKRLAFYASKIPGCVNNSGDPNSIKARSSLLCSPANTKMHPQQPTSTVNREKRPLQKVYGMNHLRMEQKISITEEPTYRKDISSICASKLPNKVVEDFSIFETQKLNHVVSWTELFLDKHIGDSMQEISQSFRRSTLNHDAEKTVTQKSRVTINKNPECFDLKLLHTHVSNGLSPFVVSENILEQTENGTSPALLTSNILNCSQEKICSTQTIKDEQKCQEERKTNVVGECEVEDHKYSARKKANFQNSYITCKENYSFSTTIDLYENPDSYFWAPLNDSSDEEWTDVVTTKSLKLSDTPTKTHINPPSSARFLMLDHMKHPSISVLGDVLPSTKNDNSFEKATQAAEDLVEIKEKDKCMDFIRTLKPDSSIGTSDNIERTIEQDTNRNISFDPEPQKDALSFLDFQFQKKSTVQKKDSKSLRMAWMDKSFEENKRIDKEQTDSPSDGENCTGDQTELELQPLKKNPSTLISSSCASFLSNPLENTACKDSCSSFDLHDKNNNGCVEGDSVIQNSVPKYVQDDINGYVSEDIIKSAIGPKGISEELPFPRVKVDDSKRLFEYDKFLTDSHYDDGILAWYYFYLNYLSQSKRFQLEEDNHSFSCEDLHGFSQEENLSAHCQFHSNNSTKDADIEDADSDFGHSGMNCYKNKRADVVKPPEEQVSKSLFTNSSARPLPHLALTDQREPGNVHCSKDKRISKIKKTGANVADTKKHCERSVNAWSSSTHGEMKPRSWYIQRPASAYGNRRKDSRSLPFSGCISLRHGKAHPTSDIAVFNRNQKKAPKCQDARRNVLKTSSAWIESRQQYETAYQRDKKRNVKSNGGTNLLSWLLLPDELWLYVFSLLTHKDICQVSQVCHHFYQLAADESLWKEIKLVNCRCLNNDWLITLGSRHPQRFTLDHCHSDNQMITEVGFKQFFQQSKGSLKELNIKNCSGPGLRGDTILLHANTFCNLLTTVDISWSGATDSGLVDLVNAAISLQSLSANGCQITDNAVAALAEKHGESLRKLEIFGCHAITAKCIRYVAIKCPNIKVLNIGRIHNITEDCLAKVVSAMKKLTSLNITGLNVVKSCVVHFIAKKCPELECLVLNSCSQVTDLSLMEISMYLPTIRYLDVSDCKEVTDVGVQALAGSCHKLSYLDLSCTSISKKGVCLLASFCFSTLECVKISFCKAVTPDAVAKLCKNCKRLKKLHLYGCRFMPDLEFIKKTNKTVEVFHDLHLPAAKLSSE